MSEHDVEGSVDEPGDEDAGPRVVPVDLRDWVDFSTDRATRVRVLATERLVTDLWCLEPMQSTQVIAHEHADVTYTVLGGRAWVVTEQGEVGLDPLGAVLVPAGVHHGLDNRSADPLTVLSSAAPPTDDAGTGQPLTRLAAAVRPDDTTGGVGQRLRAFVAGRR